MASPVWICHRYVLDHGINAAIRHENQLPSEAKWSSVIAIRLHPPEGAFPCGEHVPILVKVTRADGIAGISVFVSTSFDRKGSG